MRGEQKNVRGFDQNFDIPQKPDLILTNAGSLDSFLKHANKIKRLLLKYYGNEEG